MLHEPDPAAVGDLVDRLPPAVRLLHLHVNDWLFADRQAGADDADRGAWRVGCGDGGSR